jgi:SPP1 family predicted phage head-tail adaptor
MTAPFHGIGALRHRVTLRMPSDTADDIGGVTRSYITVGTVFAELTLNETTELLRDERKGQLRKATALLRYRNDVAADWQLLFETRPFNVVGVIDPDGRRRFTLLMLEEFAP